MDLDGSLTLATDGLHPSSAEYAIIANMQKTYLNAALA
jgi:lysophospholipase L1-like esterase